MSQLAGRKQPQLLQPFWPLEDPHGVSHVQLDGEPPLNAERVMPLMLRLAAQSDAMRSLQTSDGDLLSEQAASALRGEMAEGLRELAELVDEASAAPIRLRAKALAGSAGHREMTLAIAARDTAPPLEIICGPLCTWRMKTRTGLHSFLAAAHDDRHQDLLDAFDAALEEAMAELRGKLDAEGMKVAFPLPMHVTNLLASAGEAAGHPKHFAYFMPED
ncbi:MAG TPA: hypothetical protein VNL97_00735, partial [Solirubrobacterales bacterium]|nr:hypothetical protein [Solirubrobacterales bacterium]